MSISERPTTAISRHTTEAIFVRGHNLVDDLIGRISFTEMMYLQMLGRRPSSAQTVLLDAVLVTLMEHGITPSVIATRMVYDSSPDALQGAVAAGLLGVGSTFIGTMEGCAGLLEEMLHAPAGQDAAALDIARRLRAARQPVPGFGHPIHKPDDPRSTRLLALAEEQGVPGRHVGAIRVLSAAVDEIWQRHLTINATGAVAALLAEIGIPQGIMRGIAVVSRAAGLVGHIHEEQRKPAARYLWGVAEHAVPYQAEDGTT